MNYGFFATGSAGNLILGDENKVLTLKYSKDMRVTRRHSWVENALEPGTEYGYYDALVEPCGYGFVEEIYPESITTDEPPYIFATPNGQYNGGGIGAFVHKGGPGNWIGFEMIFAYDLYYTKIMNMASIVGQPTGWTYHICQYGAEPSKDVYGMRLWNSKGELTFDSGWDIVPFRELLRNWVPESNDPTRYYNILHYWGRRECSGDEDYVYQVGYHPWGYENHMRGVLISSLQAHDFIGDTGKYTVQRCIPIIGFKGRDRSRIFCSIAYGVLQHPYAAVSVMSKYQILSGDFSKAYKPLV